MHKTPAWLAYLFGWVTGLIFLVVEKNDEDMRWHAANSVGVFGAATVAFILLRILYFIPIIKWIAIVVTVILSIITLLAWIVLMINAGNGSKFKVPFLTDFAEKNFLNLFK